MDNGRFVKTVSYGGAWFIRDTKNGSVVAFIQKEGRPLEHTEAMVKIMLDALNGASERRRQCR